MGKEPAKGCVKAERNRHRPRRFSEDDRAFIPREAMLSHWKGFAIEARRIVR
jgi:hypothetical protein